MADKNLNNFKASILGKDSCNHDRLLFLVGKQL